MGNKLVNAPNTDATQRGEVNEQHQNAVEPVVQKDATVFSTIHQASPQTSTQLHVVNVHHDDSHEHVQPFDEVVSIRQPWRFATPCYYLPRTCAPTMQYLLVFKTNNQVPMSIWYTLMWRWNKSKYSIGWNNCVILTKNLLINQFPYCIQNMLNLK